MLKQCSLFYYKYEIIEKQKVCKEQKRKKEAELLQKKQEEEIINTLLSYNDRIFCVLTNIHDDYDADQQTVYLIVKTFTSFTNALYFINNTILSHITNITKSYEYNFNRFHDDNIIVTTEIEIDYDVYREIGILVLQSS